VDDGQDYTRRMQNIKSSLPGKTDIKGEGPLNTEQATIIPSGLTTV
jgi:hypothetical protein